MFVGCSDYDIIFIIGYRSLFIYYLVISQIVHRARKVYVSALAHRPIFQWCIKFRHHFVWFMHLTCNIIYTIYSLHVSLNLLLANIYYIKHDLRTEIQIYSYKIQNPCDFIILRSKPISKKCYNNIV